MTEPTPAADVSSASTSAPASVDETAKSKLIAELDAAQDPNTPQTLRLIAMGGAQRIGVLIHRAKDGSYEGERMVKNGMRDVTLEHGDSVTLLALTDGEHLDAFMEKAGMKIGKIGPGGAE